MTTTTQTRREAKERMEPVFYVETCRGGNHWERWGNAAETTRAEADALAARLEAQGVTTRVRAIIVPAK